MNQRLTLPPDVSANDAEILWTTAGHPFVRTPDELVAAFVKGLE